VPSSLPSRRCIPSKKDEQGGKAAITPSIPSITLAAVNAANAAAVAAANPCRKPACPLALTADVLGPVSSTLPTSLATFPAANIMPTAALAPTAKFATLPEAAAADVSVATVAAYSTLGVTITDDDTKMGVQTAMTANFATAEAAAADVPDATIAAPSVSAASVDFAAAVPSAVTVAVPVVASVGKERVSGSNIA
jgi:hypothetical protein